MRSSTLRPTARSSWRPSSKGIRGFFGSATGDKGSPPPTSRTSSTSSSAPATSPTTPAAPGWGCRSSSRSSTATRDGSGSTRSSGAVRLSPSFCRAPTPERPSPPDKNQPPRVGTAASFRRSSVDPPPLPSLKVPRWRESEAGKGRENREKGGGGAAPSYRKTIPLQPHVSWGPRVSSTGGGEKGRGRIESGSRKSSPCNHQGDGLISIVLVAVVGRNGTRA